MKNMTCINYRADNSKNDRSGKSNLWLLDVCADAFFETACVWLDIFGLIGDVFDVFFGFKFNLINVIYSQLKKNVAQ